MTTYANRGKEWTNQAQLGTGWVLCLEDINNTMFAGTNSGVIMKSTDLTNWSVAKDTGSPNNSIYDIKYLGDGIALAGTSDSNNEIYRTTDYGLTWSGINTVLGNGSCLADIGNGKVIAGGFNGCIVSTSIDYGLTWGSGVLLSENAELVNDIIYLGNGIVLASTAYTSGRIIRSTDYGAHWTDLGQLGESIWLGLFLDLGQGTVLIPNTYDKQIYKSTDYGATWNLLATIDTPADSVHCLGNLGGGVLLAGTRYTDARIYRSTNNGVTWTDLGSQFGQKYVYAFYTDLDKKYVLACMGGTGLILKSAWKDFVVKPERVYVTRKENNIIVPNIREQNRYYYDTNANTGTSLDYSAIRREHGHTNNYN